MRVGSEFNIHMMEDVCPIPSQFCDHPQGTESNEDVAIGSASTGPPETPYEASNFICSVLYWCLRRV